MIKNTEKIKKWHKKAKKDLMKLSVEQMNMIMKKGGM